MIGWKSPMEIRIGANFRWFSPQSTKETSVRERYEIFSHVQPMSSLWLYFYFNELISNVEKSILNPEFCRTLKSLSLSVKWKKKTLELSKSKSNICYSKENWPHKAGISTGRKCVVLIVNATGWQKLSTSKIAKFNKNQSNRVDALCGLNGAIHRRPPVWRSDRRSHVRRRTLERWIGSRHWFFPSIDLISI